MGGARRRATHPVWKPLATDDPAVDLVEPELAAELGRLTGLAAADQRGVRLEQAEHLLGGGDLLAPEHPPGGLVDDPRDQRREPVEARAEPDRGRGAGAVQEPTDPARLAV